MLPAWDIKNCPDLFLLLLPSSLQSIQPWSEINLKDNSYNQTQTSMSFFHLNHWSLLTSYVAKESNILTCAGPTITIQGEWWRVFSPHPLLPDLMGGLFLPPLESFLTGSHLVVATSKSAFCCCHLITNPFHLVSGISICAMRKWRTQHSNARVKSLEKISARIMQFYQL